MKTQQVIRITDTGAVEYNPAYPVEPVRDRTQDVQIVEFLFKIEYEKYKKACKEAESGFIPVTNGLVAAKWLKEHHKVVDWMADVKTKAVSFHEQYNGKIYPYTGEVKIEEKPILMNYHKVDSRGDYIWYCPKCHKGGSFMGTGEVHCYNKECVDKVAILVEKPEAKEEPHKKFERLVKDSGMLPSLQATVADAEQYLELLKLRTANDKLQKFKDYVHDRLDKMGVPVDPEPDSNKSHGCRIEGRLNYIEAANKELVEGLKHAIELNGYHLTNKVITKWKELISKHSNL